MYTVVSIMFELGSLLVVKTCNNLCVPLSYIEENEFATFILIHDSPCELWTALDFQLAMLLRLGDTPQCNIHPWVGVDDSELK